MRHLFAISLTAMVAATAGAAPAPMESWGKAGITLPQYRQDALECGLKGYYTDVSKTEDAQELVRASRRLDAITTGSFAPSTTGAGSTGPASTDSLDQTMAYAAEQHHIIESARPELRYRNIKKTLVSTTEECLSQRGYSRFVLTDGQRKKLRKLKAGSDARRAYLYSLASNPTILQGQRAAPAQP